MPDPPLSLRLGPLKFIHTVVKQLDSLESGYKMNKFEKISIDAFPMRGTVSKNTEHTRNSFINRESDTTTG
jgi:hypothetical protein